MPDSFQSDQELQEWLAQEFGNRLSQVVGSMTGAAPEVKCEKVTAPGETLGLDRLWWEQTFNLAPGAVLWAAAPRASWEEIGRRVLAAAGLENATAENCKSTFQEVLNQALSGLAQALSSRLRKQVVCKEGEETPSLDEAQPSYSVGLVFADIELTVCLAIPQAFLEALSKRPDKSETTDAKAPRSIDKKAQTPNHSVVSPGVLAGPQTSPIDLLLDVELPVSVSFGRAQLLLKDVIKLTTGSIVELNRTISEPVEVIVNNCVIARGQVVVIEGNFGIRIEQVVSRQERLRTLK